MPSFKKNLRKKVAIFFSGGTTLVTCDGPKIVSKKADVRGWLAYVPELAVLAETYGFFIGAENQLVRIPDHWTNLAQEIERRMGDFDGIVVIHDSASLIYAACAISFAIQNSPLPIVFTSSPGILEKEPDPKGLGEFGPVGLKANLLNAVQIATMNSSDVSIVDRTSFVRATNAQRVKLGKYKQIIAPAEAVLGSIEFGVVLSEFRTKRTENDKTIFKPKFAPAVAVYLDFPQDLENLEQAFKTSPRGLIIHGRGVDPLNKNVLEKLDIKIPTLILTNAETKVPSNLKAIIVPNLTREAAVTKFMWALAQTNNIEKLREIMHQNLVGEQISSKGN